MVRWRYPRVGVFFFCTCNPYHISDCCCDALLSILQKLLIVTFKMLGFFFITRFLPFPKTPFEFNEPESLPFSSQFTIIISVIPKNFFYPRARWVQFKKIKSFFFSSCPARHLCVTYLARLAIFGNVLKN